MTRWIVCFALSLTLLGAGVDAARADDDAAQRLRARAERALAVNQADESRRADWEQAYREILLDRQRIEQRLQSAQLELGRLRSRLRDQGAPRLELEAAIEENGKALHEADSELAEFRERARQAAVPRGWLEGVEEAVSRPASPSRDE